MRKRRNVVLSAGLAVLLTFPFTSTTHAETNHAATTKATPHPFEVQLLGVNDFHGQLDVTRKVNGRSVGRADYLAAYLKQQKAKVKDTLLLAVGDNVGASAPVSALMQDEPTINIFNTLHFDVSTIGNHEFDHGVNEMIRQIYGGRNPNTGEFFKGANYPYICANVVTTKTKKPILPPYLIKKVHGAKIGFIGVVTTETPTITMPSNVKNIEFTDETEAINKYAKELKKQGVQTIVVLAHDPGTSAADGSNANGRVYDIAQHTDPEVDVIFGGHNHAYMNTKVNGKLVVQAYSFGTAFDEVHLWIDPKTKDVVKSEAKIVNTYQDAIQPDPQVKQMIDEDEAKVAPLINKVVGSAATALTQDQNASGESNLGDFITDAQRASTNAQIAITNPGGIRANINSGEITWGELFTVQPFNNQLITMNLTGDQIRQALNQQWATGRMLQMSGMKYTWDSTLGTDKIVSLTLEDGTPIEPNQTYSVTMNSFLASGGDGFTVFASGQNPVTGQVDLDALVDYVQKQTAPINVTTGNRIQKIK
ncbi:bifunctional metallophosphatase/5'-nucleotidase [Peribacillus kribbensis]|uniref:bifunctional metallophosphatase/5'-nucleotidase n=1 Tax=Peribacillus kribbensis TaxID=356658 RepID=UPI00040BA5DA|nr:5'-nucleotidase C-terminal domain-containing protein [Peribacillus kribbensis]